MSTKEKKKAVCTPKGSILIAHGVNLDLLGRRETSLYGTDTLADINAFISDRYAALGKVLSSQYPLTFFQSNDEQAFLEKFTERPWVGALINAGAWTHTSLALADRLATVTFPYIEVHLSNILSREEFRHRSYLAPHAHAVILGAGKISYSSALYALLQILADYDASP